MVVCDGYVLYDEVEKEESFSQRFLLSKQGDVWKVSNDCFRLIDHL